ncbi:MAG: hypothetical protein JXB60_03715 [Candidatus Cloacimonetes bacterium]|nr:hypothetical protein [Candidatus Cloacimonadota bacterium]
MKYILITALVILIVISVGLYILWQPIAIGHDDTPINTIMPPIQEVNDELLTFNIDLKKGRLIIIPLFKYSIKARVINKKRYGGSWDAKISPYDLVLGWGDLANALVDDHIKFDQWGRFYFYSFDNSPYQNDYISKHSANNHIIPANDNIRRALSLIRKNDLVVLNGYLVDINGVYKDKSVSWRTSTTREDTGSGSCEIIYLTNCRIGDKVFY